MYIAKDESSAVRWLKENLSENDLVLSSSMTGNIIPAYSGRKVFIGHGHQTSEWPDKLVYVSHFFFFTNGADSQKQAWLKKEGVDYLFFGPTEKSLGQFRPKEKPYLRMIFEQGETAIFKVY